MHIVYIHPLVYRELAEKCVDSVNKITEMSGYHSRVYGMDINIGFSRRSAKTGRTYNAVIKAELSLKPSPYHHIPVHCTCTADFSDSNEFLEIYRRFMFRLDLRSIEDEQES